MRLRKQLFKYRLSTVDSFKCERYMYKLFFIYILYFTTHVKKGNGEQPQYKENCGVGSIILLFNSENEGDKRIDNNNNNKYINK